MLLLALAIIDDIGAILVIALFYSSGIQALGVAFALSGVAFVLVMQRLGVRNAFAYVAPGAVVWFGMLRAGIHPSIAGVVLGLVTPARSWFGEQGFLRAAGAATSEFRELARREAKRPEDLLEPLRKIRQAEREALPPVTRIQLRLHPWVAFGIMPLFALANAGVPLAGISVASAPSATLITGVVAGLVVGKPLGIAIATALSVRLGLCRLPTGITWRGVLLVGCTAGIGFTMAIFVAGLAFSNPADLGTAKLGILIGSLVSAIVGLAVGFLLPETASAGS